MKIISLTLLASLTFSSAALAERVTVHASIGVDQMQVKTNSSEVMWSSNLENIRIGDEQIQKTGTFLVRCGDDGKQYAMIAIPGENDVWPKLEDDLRIKVSVMGFGSDLEISGSDLLSMKVGRERLLYIDLGNKVSEFVRHWYAGMSVRFSASPGNGLADLSFIVAAPVPDADARERMAKTVALCQILAR
ncbi:hypothetical protein A6U85_24080 [Agrobacterium sp. 13-626]|uniref:hypothetical protein n=1 Tax=Rhizobium rhizogenes TaxID=359 RepID=UPI0008100F99|nr:hypothetical protein [Rhizobium rhizogenes]NTI75990.1 hypothetical protein [Rhizobium rhizogenes]OCI91448.1 hypothetical protein A6U85_24080 [Agrobacterium sp. 13-626]